MVKKIKSRRSGKEDSSKPSTELESADIKPEKDEEKLHAVRAFKSFLDRKTGYEAPPFLKKALEVPEDKWNVWWHLITGFCQKLPSDGNIIEWIEHRFGK